MPMKKLFFLFPLLALTAFAATVTGPIADTSGGAYNPRVEFYPLSQPYNNGNTNLVGPMRSIAPVGGNFSAVFVAGRYLVKFPPTTNSFYINVPNDSGTYSLAVLSTNVSGVTGIAASPLEKVKISSTDTNAGYLSTKLLPGSNVTFTTNNTSGDSSITIASTGGGGGGTQTNISYTAVTNAPWITNNDTRTLTITNFSWKTNTLQSYLGGSVGFNTDDQYSIGSFNGSGGFGRPKHLYVAEDIYGLNFYGGTFTGTGSGLTNLTYAPVLIADTGVTITTNTIAATGQKTYSITTSGTNSVSVTNVFLQAGSGRITVTTNATTSWTVDVPTSTTNGFVTQSVTNGLSDLTNAANIYTNIKSPLTNGDYRAGLSFSNTVVFATSGVPSVTISNGQVTATTFSGALSSTSTATTATAGDNDTSIATTAFVDTAKLNATNKLSTDLLTALSGFTTNGAVAGDVLTWTNGVLQWTNPPAGGSGSQTPWAQTVNAAGYDLTNAGTIQATNLALQNLYATNVTYTTNWDASLATNIPITALNGSGGAGTAATNGTAGWQLLSAGNGGVYWSAAAAGTQTNISAAAVTNAGNLIWSNATAVVLYPTNTGTDGQIVSLTGNKTKWINDATGSGSSSSNLTDSGYTVLVRSNMVFTNSGLAQLIIGATNQVGASTNALEVVYGGVLYARIGTNGIFHGNGAGLTNVTATGVTDGRFTSSAGTITSASNTFAASALQSPLLRSSSTSLQLNAGNATNSIISIDELAGLVSVLATNGLELQSGNFIGNGSSITNLAYFKTNQAAASSISNNLSLNIGGGTMTATTFSGSASSLTGFPAGSLSTNGLIGSGPFLVVSNNLIVLSNAPAGSGGGFTGNANQFSVANGSTNIISGVTLTNAQLYSGGTMYGSWTNQGGAGNYQRGGEWYTNDVTTTWQSESNGVVSIGSNTLTSVTLDGVIGKLTLTNVTAANNTAQLALGTNSIEATSMLEAWNPQGTRIFDLETNGAIVVSNLTATVITNTSLTGTRVVITDANKKEISASVTSPILGTGAAAAWSDIQALAPTVVQTNGATTVYSNSLQIVAQQQDFQTNLAATASAPVVDFAKGYALMSTNADFSFATTVAGLNANLVQTAVIIVTNAAKGSLMTVTVPSVYKLQGSPYVTNNGQTVFTFMQYGGRFTNVTALPLF